MAGPETNTLLLAAVAACDEKKAEDIRILRLDPAESGLSDYFVICNGTNSRQNVAITDEVELRLKREFGVYPNSVEGRREGEWVLMDYVDFILHVFSPEKREFYGLERLRKSATTVSPAELDEELKRQVKAARGKGAKTAKSREGDGETAVELAAGTEPAAKKKAVKKAPAKKVLAKSASAKKVPAKKKVADGAAVKPARRKTAVPRKSS